MLPNGGAAGFAIRAVAQLQQHFAQRAGVGHRIDDPHFLPWKQEGVQPGKSVPAKLVGAASARLSVVDAATNAPVAHCALRVRFENAPFRPNEFEVFDAKKGLPADGLVAGLIPGDQTLIVLAEGYAPCELHVADLAAGPARELTAKLQAAKP